MSREELMALMGFGPPDAGQSGLYSNTNNVKPVDPFEQHGSGMASTANNGGRKKRVLNDGTIEFTDWNGQVHVGPQTEIDSLIAQDVHDHPPLGTDGKPLPALGFPSSGNTSGGGVMGGAGGIPDNIRQQMVNQSLEGLSSAEEDAMLHSRESGAARGMMEGGTVDQENSELAQKFAGAKNAAARNVNIDVAKINEQSRIADLNSRRSMMLALMGGGGFDDDGGGGMGGGAPAPVAGGGDYFGFGHGYEQGKPGHWPVNGAQAAVKQQGPQGQGPNNQGPNNQNQKPPPPPGQNPPAGDEGDHSGNPNSWFQKYDKMFKYRTNKPGYSYGYPASKPSIFSVGKFNAGTMTALGKSGGGGY